ncbi:E3 ubiquitin-protein ligase TRIM45-like [Oculina patagonica]
MDVQQLFRNLRKEAECPLCLETVNEPKTLPCLHSFCLLCLDKHADYARRQLQTTIKCPVCLTCFQIPEGDTFDGLPTSFHLNRLVDLLALRDGSTEAQRCSSCDENNTATCYCFVCQNFLCTACFEAHQRLKATRGHRNILVENLQAQDVEELIRRPVICSQQYHEDQALEYYCEECKVCICHKCSVVSHNRHTIVEMQKAADEQKMQITDALEKVKAEVVIYENLMKKETESMAKNKAEISDAERKMAETVDECIRILTEHKLAMNTKFNKISQAQLKAHATQMETFQFAVTQLKSSVEHGERMLERNINAEILQTKQVIIGRCEELLSAKKPGIYKPPHVHYVVENKADICDRVVVSNTDPSLSLVEGQCEKEIEEKTETSFTIVTRDSDGIQCYHGDDHIKVNIQTPTGDALKIEIEDSKDGKYTVTYTPECVGQYRVGIEVNGQPLTGSPWSVQVVPHQYQFLFKFGSSGKGPGQFSCPLDIAVSEKTGTIAVTDSDNLRIQLFSSDGKFLKEIKQENCSVAFTKSSEILTIVPERCGAAASASDGGGQRDDYHYHHDDADVKKDHGHNVRGEDHYSDGDEDDAICAVVDQLFQSDVLHKISLFTESGQFIKYINNEHVKKPCYVSVASDDCIVTCDWPNNKIIAISTDEKQLLQSFSIPDCDKSIFWAVYHQDTFFVSYTRANCVKVFNKEGMFLYNIGSKGSDVGQLKFPTGLAIDKFNHLIVCDSGNDRLQVFTLDGKFLTKIEQHFCKKNCLLSVAVTNNGHMLVVNGDENCVYVFQ